jgi:hypothetical protein
MIDPNCPGSGAICCSCTDDKGLPVYHDSYSEKGILSYLVRLLKKVSKKIAKISW